ncbi:tetratricopeptide repeat protein [Cohnella pontilimi]|uniref:Tetratricopeptide repeat protein n=1 Tax=Cohnella pontilimi TaxID=2564100 RepID=A0A4U0FLT1_9BACL|nr:YIP1 family protein [Cohnella pontilimi]TJY44532.1 tetratricopeptide repeat protein [Cohnella pontilimi]
MRRLRLGFVILIVTMASIFTGTLTAFAVPALGYVIAPEGYRISVPLGYSVDRVLTGDYENGMLKNPEDLFIDSRDQVYIADTANNRVLKMDKFGKILKVFGTKEDKLNLMEPRGIFVEDDGDIYIADTGNNRIVHLSPEGQMIEKFVAPKSDLIDKDFPFMPTKLVLDRSGNMYVTSGNDYHGLLVIDGQNQFQGYIAPNKLKFNLKDYILRKYATKEQREALGKVVPPNHRNVTIDLNSGYLYTAIENTTIDEIKRFNFLGINTYPADKHYGEFTNRRGIITSPNVVDVSVDKDGIITTVDSNQRKVYQYDQEGNNLLVFGGNGDQTGFFQEPVSVANDSEGLLYVLDRARGEVQVFRANHFASLVHKGSRLYYDGRYEEALQPWREVVNIDSNYIFAHRGIGKALYKEQKWKDAMAEFRLGEDMGSYSNAFREYRHETLRHQFGWIALIIAVMGAALYYSIVALTAYSRKVLASPAGSGNPSIQNAILTIFAPREAFYRIQSAPRYMPVIVLVLGMLAARFFHIYFTSFHFNLTRPEFADFYYEVAQLIVPFFLFTASAWMITSIMDGESKFKQILAACSYGVIIPYIIGTVAQALMSHVLSRDELSIYNGISTVTYCWMGLCVFFLIMTMNDYTVGKTIWVIVISILTAIALLLVGILFYILMQHVIDFFKEVFLEVYISGF